TVVDDFGRRYDSWQARLQTRYLDYIAARWTGTAEPHIAWIEPYTPRVTAPSGWLPILVERIQASTLPREYDAEPSSEWLSEDAANAAIAFFNTGVDLLPNEPHIYATNAGDLVAEFETAMGTMTSVISDKETILFAVLETDPSEPMQATIRRGSNQLRDELRSFTRKLLAESHGPMDTTKE
ncbi:MAG: hypothetical protein KDA55_02260, partial [Planctomycetales bacterium]|nr:hypothetical protein [Planctomycetales bacterium]